MSDLDVEILVCQSTKELKNPRPESVIRKCERCGCEIWAMQQNLSYGLHLMCGDCVKQLIAENPEEELSFQPANVLYKPDRN